MSQNRPDRGSPPSTPRWVKIFGIILIVLILAVVVVHLTVNNFGGRIPHMP
jgi:hypothetical protein